nr:hypothetical protein [Henriciella sp.]
MCIKLGHELASDAALAKARMHGDLLQIEIVAHLRELAEADNAVAFEFGDVELTCLYGCEQIFFKNVVSKRFF